ncbi:M20/M25/M40 family metallo-hydrolase, partial [candidate division KSB1 bacterium]|nr:M20/M25/M40 family metallo-hydrolase [candidate division KSB1 bacterium]
PGTAEDSVVAEYCRRDLLQSGLELLSDAGWQALQVVADLDTGSNNSFRYPGLSPQAGKDFMPLSFSGDGVHRSSVVFAGYGFDFDIDSLDWHDYRKIDVQGKWVMVLRGDPESDQPMSVFSPFSDLRKKAMVARDRGAAGILFVSGSAFEAEEKWLPLSSDRAPRMAGFLAVQIRRDLADRLLSASGFCVDTLEARLNRTRMPISFSAEVEIDVSVDLREKSRTTHNIIALLPGGDPEIGHEIIVLGAHHDHLGMGGANSGSRRPDTTAVHNGADDNASGVAAVLEIVEKLATRKRPLRRSVMAVLFAAEEMGMLGSKHFVDNPPVELNRIKAMLNIDMIGRLDPDSRSITVGGTGTSPFFEQAVQAHLNSPQLNLSLSPEGYGPSDHASFYGQDIPVLFISSGAHEDYHTPDDDVEKIDFDGMKTIADALSELIVELANSPEPIRFQQAGPKEMPRPRRFKVTLGIMPDHAARGIEGLRVQVVTPGKPADLAGMVKGDVIVEIDGRPVKDIYEYMHRLSELKPGQRSSVGVVRDGKKKILIVQL